MRLFSRGDISAIYCYLFVKLEQLKPYLNDNNYAKQLLTMPSDNWYQPNTEKLLTATE